jgi:hypothetical protein
MLIQDASDVPTMAGLKKRYKALRPYDHDPAVYFLYQYTQFFWFNFVTSERDEPEEQVHPNTLHNHHTQ